MSRHSPDIDLELFEGRQIRVGKAVAICTNPPEGSYRVVGLYVNPTDGNLIVVYDDEPVN